MIFNRPKTWQELQDNVSLLLNQVGFDASTNKLVTTPRGSVEIDVYATDPFSIDNITYIIECKNWGSKVPQTVIHSFTTVMQETGANIGYIISKNGFQKGAYDYIKNTNIVVLTFEQLQKRYLKKWLSNHFYTIIDNASNSLIQYTEPLNSRRERYLSNLSTEKRQQYYHLLEKYVHFSVIILSMGCQSKSKLRFRVRDGVDEVDLKELKQELSMQSFIKFHSNCFMELLAEVVTAINDVTMQFNGVFEKDIFQEKV